MNWVLRRNEDGAFVARSGNARGASYSHDVLDARLFVSREAAERDACGNERAVTLEQAVAEGRR